MAQEQGVICVTTDNVPGRNIRQALCLVYGLHTTIPDAYARLESAVKAYGGNAVVGTRIVAYASLESPYCIIYGTAVILE